jgi:hypothetical protein
LKCYRPCGIGKGIRGREEKCGLRGHSGLKALGGGLIEEVVRTPLGKCSLKTHTAYGVARREAAPI